MINKEGYGKVYFTARTELFIAEYQVDRNGAAAARRAGYSPKSANVAAAKLMANKAVMEAIELQTLRKLEEVGITSKNVLAELGRLAFGNVGQLFDASGELRPIQELPDFVTATISKIEHEAITTKDGTKLGMTTKVTMADKIGPLKILAQHLGLLKDKVKDDRPLLTKTDDELAQDLAATLETMGFHKVEPDIRGKLIEMQKG